MRRSRRTEGLEAGRPGQGKPFACWRMDQIKRNMEAERWRESRKLL